MTEQAKDITPEEIEGFKKHYLTIGQLKEYLAKSELDDSALVMVERVTDSYFTEKGGWKTMKVSNFMFGESKDEFIPAWCVSKQPDKKETLLFTMSRGLYK